MEKGKSATATFLGWAALLALLLLAFGLRAYRLDQQSLWYDEGGSVHYARLGLLDLIEVVPLTDHHPPFYFLLLRLWTTAAGSSEFSLRFLSLLFGLLALPLTYQLARMTRSSSGSLLTTLLVGISPWYLWYSQEVRMYSLVVALSAASACCLLEALARGRAHLWIIYLLLCLLGLYTHYYFALVLLAEGLFFALWWLTLGGRQKGVALRWGATQMALGVLLLPMLGWIVRQAGSSATYWWGTIDLWSALREWLLALAVGRTLEGPLATMAALGYLLLFCLGIGSWRIGRRKEGSAGILFLLTFFLAPTLILAAILLGRPKFDPRYLMAASPAYYIGSAAGLAALLGWRRKPGWKGMASLSLATALSWLIIAASVASLFNTLFLECYAREDFRGALRYIEENAYPGDALLLLAGHTLPLVEYYGPQGIPVYPLPQRLVIDVGNPLGEEVIAEMNRIASQHPRVWLLLWQREMADPRGIVLRQMEAKAERLDVGKTFHGLDLLYYSLNSASPFTVTPQISYPTSFNFGEALELRGYELDRTEAKPGEILSLTLFWRAKAKVGQDFFAFVHLLNKGDHVYGQMDKRPPNDYYPTYLWRVGETIADDYRVQIPWGTPPGSYTIEVGLYDQPGMQRLLVKENGQASLRLGSIKVLRPEAFPVPFPVQRTQRVDYGPLRLLGYELEREHYRPGEALPLRLFWEVKDEPEEELQAAVRLKDASGHVLTAREGPPADGAYPVGLWRPGEVVRDTWTLYLSPQAVRGRYTLEVGLRTRGGSILGDKEWTPLGVSISLR